MLLPLTYTEAILCLTLAMLLWGLWPNLQRMAGKWRYELFFWDFSVGVFAAALLAAFTFGSLNAKELTFQDNLLIASYHKIAYGLAAGLVINLANLLFAGALSVAPLSVVFPIGLGVGLIVEVAWTLFPPQGNLLLPLGGAVVVLTAIIVNAFTYNTYAQEQRGPKKPLSPDPRAPSARPPMPGKGILLSAISGVILGMAAPLVTVARTGEDGLAAYTAALMIGIATLLSTLIFSPFFMVFAVHGAPVQLRAYFKGTKAQHLFGVGAGAIWCVALIAAFGSGGTLATVQAGMVAARGFAAGAALLATACGWLAWKEFSGCSYRVRMLLTAMLVVWIVGASMLVLSADAPK